jgi:hypothetical protein
MRTGGKALIESSSGILEEQLLPVALILKRHSFSYESDERIALFLNC